MKKFISTVGRKYIGLKSNLDGMILDNIHYPIVASMGCLEPKEETKVILFSSDPQAFKEIVGEAVSINVIAGYANIVIGENDIGNTMEAIYNYIVGDMRNEDEVIWYKAATDNIFIDNAIGLALAYCWTAFGTKFKIITVDDTATIIDITNAHDSKLSEVAHNSPSSIISTTIEFLRSLGAI